jgi:hypothetical protein
VNHRSACFVARGHAPTASFRADPAVFVHTEVLLALVGAKAASSGAGVEHSPDHLVVETRPSRGDPTGDVADVRAVEVQPDALR